ncbi:MAG TPA: hypothetical protein VHN17_04680 [Steroidobacteraceae bacterium]|nr:hypothetical protein [Steroidobacteraceae bacterium]
MDDAEVNTLCEQLTTLIELEAGCNPEALSRARWAIMSLKSMELGDDVDEKLVGLAEGFEEWFSIDKWNSRDDGGRLVKQSLEDDLICIRAAMWCKSQGSNGT